MFLIFFSELGQDFFKDMSYIRINFFLGLWFLENSGQDVDFGKDFFRGLRLSMDFFPGRTILKDF